jgi:F0F1-type ATP synthase delta subunit
MYSSCDRLCFLALSAPRSQQLRQALSAQDITQEQRDKLISKFATKRSRLISQFAQWCQAIVSNPDFSLLKPVLEQVRGEEIRGAAQCTMFS